MVINNHSIYVTKKWTKFIWKWRKRAVHHQLHIKSKLLQKLRFIIRNLYLLCAFKVTSFNFENLYAEKKWTIVFLCHPFLHLENVFYPADCRTALTISNGNSSVNFLLCSGYVSWVPSLLFRFRSALFLFSKVYY